MFQYICFKGVHYYLRSVMFTVLKYQRLYYLIISISVDYLFWGKLRFLCFIICWNILNITLGDWVLVKASGERWCLLLAFLWSVVPMSVQFSTLLQLFRAVPEVRLGSGQRYKHQFSSQSFGMLIRIRSMYVQFEGWAQGFISNFIVSLSPLLSITSTIHPQYFC